MGLPTTDDCARAAIVALALFVAPALAQSDYQLRPHDTLNIVVTDQPDLSKKYVLDDTGALLLPLIGELRAAGLTTTQLEAEIRQRLNGFLVNPQVRIDVERTKRVFVFGGVASPGMYQLTENMTLVELLARVGYGGASEVLIIRRRGEAPAVPSTDANPEVLRVNLREFEKDLESGKLSRNVLLEEGDTIFIPRYDPNRIYVSGEVRNAGAYSVPEGTTVLQALTLAGGPTQYASLGRTRILRLVNGRLENIKAELKDVVRPGDTILVRERIF